MESVVFDINSAMYGGGIYRVSVIVCRDAQFLSNRASEGGGVYALNSSVPLIQFCGKYWWWC